MAAPPKNRSRRGAKIRNGAPSSMANIAGAGNFLEPQRQLIRIPANPRRQRLGLVMKRERGEIAPVRIAAQQFHAAGRKHELEQQQPQQPENDSRRRRFARRFWQPLQRRKKNGEKAGFEQQVVPLKTKKIAANRGQRKINQPEQRQAWRGRDADNQQDRKNGSGGALEI